MDRHDVERLAVLENARWRRSDPTSVADASLADAAVASAPADRLASFRFLDAAAVGQVLVIRFGWAPDPERHEILLHLDMSVDAPRPAAR